MIPSGKLTYIAIENGPVEIVSFPPLRMVMFHSYVSLPEGKYDNDNNSKNFDSKIVHTGTMMKLIIICARSKDGTIARVCDLK
jgi:hypothetical protein